jgi:hypothetical protein
MAGSKGVVGFIAAVAALIGAVATLMGVLKGAPTVHTVPEPRQDPQSDPRRDEPGPRHASLDPWPEPAPRFDGPVNVSPGANRCFSACDKEARKCEADCSQGQRDVKRECYPAEADCDMRCYERAITQLLPGFQCERECRRLDDRCKSHTCATSNSCYETHCRKLNDRCVGACSR